MDETLVIQACADWIENGQGDECFWDAWEECPTEIVLTPNMVMAALTKSKDATIIQK